MKMRTIIGEYLPATPYITPVTIHADTCLWVIPTALIMTMMTAVAKLRILTVQNSVSLDQIEKQKKFWNILLRPRSINGSRTLDYMANGINATSLKKHETHLLFYTCGSHRYWIRQHPIYFSITLFIHYILYIAIISPPLFAFKHHSPCPYVINFSIISSRLQQL